MVRILITRPRAQSDVFAQALEDAGYQPVLFPVIQISPVADTSSLDQALCRLAWYDWLVLTSVNAVDVVAARLIALQIDRLPERLRVAAIGPKTARAIQRLGYKPDFVPPEYVAEAILPGLGDLKGRWVLLPRADLARPDLPRLIERSGGTAHEIIAYRTLPTEPDPTGMASLRQGVDIVTFTSSSTVRNFSELIRSAGLCPRDLPGNPKIACIGPITADTARQEGYVVDVVAQEYTIEGLVGAIKNLLP